MNDPRSAARYEWERIVRRIVLPSPTKLLALVLATYADPDGSRVRPGNDRLAAVTGNSRATIKRHLSALRDLGLLAVNRRGGGRGGNGVTTEYQLTVPADLLDRVQLLDPDESAENIPADMPAAEPVDNPDSGVIQVSPESGEAELIEGSFGADSERLRAQIERLRAHSYDLLPTHNYQPPDQPIVVPYRGESRPRARDPVDSLRSAS